MVELENNSSIKNKKGVMNIILWIIFGAIAGWIASMIMKTDSQQGFLGDVIVGVLGAVVGGYLMQMFGQSDVSGFNVYSMIVAVIGASVLLFLKRTLMRS